MTEVEVVMMSMTNEELDDAVRWLEYVLAEWRQSRAVLEARYGEQIPGHADVLASTDGPVHLIRAMDLAIIRERAGRGGAEPWYAGMPLEDHPARTYIRYYQERITLNPDEGHKPRLSAAGVLEKVCIGCGAAKPLTVGFWPWLGASLDDHCRACRYPAGASQHAVAIRQALVDADDAAAGTPAPVEPFVLDPDPEPDPSLAPAADPALAL